MLAAMFFLEQNQYEFCSTIYLYIIYFIKYNYTYNINIDIDIIL